MFVYQFNFRSMQDIRQVQNDDVGASYVPKSKPTNAMNKIMNNRYLNQNIYTMFLQKRYQECLTLIDRCKPDQFKLFIRSLVEKNSYRLQKSVQLLNECLVMNKLNYSYLKSIAKNFYLLGKYKSSLEVAKDAYKLNSMDYEIFYIMGKISLALNDSPNALANFKHSISKEPNQQSFIETAKIYMANNEFLQAADVLKQCIGFSQENPEAFEMLGICSFKMGRNDLAQSYYSSALQVDSMKYNSLIGLGSIILEKGQVDEALQIFKKAYKTSSNSSVLWNNIGISMFQKNKAVAAYCCFKRALFLDPFRWDIHANIALVFISKQKYLPAQIHLRSALKLNRDASLFNLLGVCLSQLKDYVNAEKSFEQGLKMQVSNSQIRYNLMVCLKKKGQIQKSKKLYEQLSRKVDNPIIRQKILFFSFTAQQQP